MSDRSEIRKAVLKTIELYNTCGGVGLVFMQRNIKAQKHEVTQCVQLLKSSEEIKSQLTDKGIKYFLK